MRHRQADANAEHAAEGKIMPDGIGLKMFATLSDDTLIARGKVATLRKERRQQLERVQSICTTMVTTAQAILRDCEQRPPANVTHLETMRVCLNNMLDARERLITLCLGLAELEPEAWGKE